MSSKASPRRLCGRLLTRRHHDIQATEWVSLTGLVGWMVALGLNRWLYPGQTYTMLARVGSVEGWQIACTIITVAKAISLALGYRSEKWAYCIRRAIMVLVVGWWCFLTGTLLQFDPLWPGIGSHLAGAVASAWACYKVTWRRTIDGGG